MEVWIPGHRLVSVMERSDVQMTDSERKLIDHIRSGRQEFVSLDRADRIIQRLDMTAWWHICKEDGGLSDIYVDGEQYGEPSHVAVSRLPRPYRRKYATEEERLEARRASWRRKYWRKKEREAA